MSAGIVGGIVTFATLFGISAAVAAVVYGARESIRNHSRATASLSTSPNTQEISATGYTPLIAPESTAHGVTVEQRSGN